MCCFAPRAVARPAIEGASRPQRLGGEGDEECPGPQRLGGEGDARAGAEVMAADCGADGVVDGAVDPSGRGSGSVRGVLQARVSGRWQSSTTGTVALMVTVWKRIVLALGVIEGDCSLR
jgi:hypothetical protein